MYRELARRYTTTDLDPKQIHEFGVTEVARIRGEMLPVIARTGYKGSLDDFLKFARTDPRMYFSNSDDLLAAYRAALTRIDPLVRTVIGHIPSRQLKVEPYQGNVAAMWYAPRPGQPEAVIYVAVNNPEIHPKFEIVPLMLHEGTPGHELQHAVADEVHAGDVDAVSTFERNAGQNVAFAEGWALYAEGLGTEMGFVRRSLRSVWSAADGTHSGGAGCDRHGNSRGWLERKPREGVFPGRNGEARDGSRQWISRTLWPGSQLAYKVGQFRIQRLREETSRALGAQFNLRAFHDAILRWGPLQLDVLERKLRECLNAPSCSAELRRIEGKGKTCYLLPSTFNLFTYTLCGTMQLRRPVRAGQHLVRLRIACRVHRLRIPVERPAEAIADVGQVHQVALQRAFLDLRVQVLPLPAADRGDEVLPSDHRAWWPKGPASDPVEDHLYLL